MESVSTFSAAMGGASQVEIREKLTGLMTQM
jgi:hypothetical protein